MKRKGLISTKMATTPANEPLKWMHASVANPDFHGVRLPSANGNPNEHVVYKVAQIKMHYVFVLKWKGSRRK